MTSRTAVAVIASSEIVRRGLIHVLNDNDFTVVVSAASIAEFYARSEEDVAVVVMALEARDDVAQASAELVKACPGARHVLTAAHFGLNDIVHACKQAIDGLILKGASAEQFACSLRLVALGERVLPGIAADYLVGDRCPAPPAVPQGNEAYSHLSSREAGILRRIAEGDSNKTIALYHGISEATVKVHVKAILRKLRLSNRTQAALWATRNLVSMPSQVAA